MRRAASVSRFSRVPEANRTIQAPARRPSPFARTSSRNEGKAVPTRHTPNYTFNGIAIFKNQSLKSASCIDIPTNTKDLQIQNNLLEDFIGFPGLENLESIDVSNNQIKSLAGIPYYPRLASFRCANTPLVRHDYYRIAILLVTGPSMRIINGERVTAAERQLAKQYSKECIALIRAGWILTYPPPKPDQIQQLKSKISHQIRKNTPKSSPKIISQTPRSQSRMLQTSLMLQEKEMALLMQEINQLEQ